nr:hypothetical protein [Tanacetum cinerariifolium]
MNTLDYTPASPDYFPASPGNTPSDSSNDLTKDLLASLAFLPFYDDPYMKEILPPKKRACGRSSSSTSVLPQVFEIKESSRVTRLERLEEQIEKILNHLDELSLDRIEHMGDKIEAPSMTQATIKKLVGDSVAAALETQVATMENTKNTNRNTRPRETYVARKGNYKEFISYQPIYFNAMEGAVGLIRWFKQTESVFSRSNCDEENKVTFATGTLTDDAFSWWNAYSQPIRIEQANKITWTELKRLLTNKYYPRTEVKKMEDEVYNLIVKGNDLKIYGLPQSMEGTVTASRPQTLEEATNIAQRLMDQIIKRGFMQGTNDHKRKFDDRRNITNNNNYPNNHINNYQNNRNNNSNRNNDYRQPQNRRNCRNKRPGTGSNQRPVSVTCHACREKEHYNYQCSKANNNAHGRTYLLRDKTLTEI